MEKNENIKDRRLNKPQHVRQVLSEQLNILRKLQPTTIKEQQDNARTIAYISNTVLTAMRDGEALEKLEEVKQMVESLTKGKKVK